MDFIAFLVPQQLPSAVLLGSVDDSNRELSKIDFVLNTWTFIQLPGLIEAQRIHASQQLFLLETGAAGLERPASEDIRNFKRLKGR